MGIPHGDAPLRFSMSTPCQCVRNFLHRAAQTAFLLHGLNTNLAKAGEGVPMCKCPERLLHTKNERGDIYLTPFMVA